jgi:hypothetical protein
MKRSQLLLMVIVATSLAIGFNNCTFEVAKNSDSESGLSELVQGQKLYSANCAACHGPVETSTKRNSSVELIRDAIHSQPSMKYLSTLTSTEIELIALALKTEVVPPEDLDKPEVSTSDVPVGNRHLKASLFTEFFVADQSDRDTADEQIISIIDENLRSRVEAFGGNCSRYDSDCVPEPCGMGRTERTCKMELEVKVSALPAPPSNVLAKGYLVKACEEILAVDKAVQTALERAQLRTELLPEPEPNQANVAILLDFFFRGRPVAPAAIVQTTAVATAAASSGMNHLDQWRFVMLSACQSTEADVL